MTDLGSTHFIQFCIQYASIALLYYDYALTFPLEVRYIWMAEIRFSTVLYVFCRYALVANLIYLLNIANKLNISCDNGYRISGALSVLGRVGIVIIWSVRTYAVCNKSRYVLAFFSVVGSAAIILSIIHVPAIRCEGNSSIPIVGGLLTILTCALEIASAVLTTIRGVQALKISGIPRTTRNGFVFLVLEQGVLYFSVTSLFTLASLIIGAIVSGGFFQRLLNALTLPLSGLLTARFFLHIRRWEDKHTTRRTSRDGPLTSTNIQFTTIVSSLWSLADELGDDPVIRARERGEEAYEMPGVG